MRRRAAKPIARSSKSGLSQVIAECESILSAEGGRVMTARDYSAVGRPLRYLPTGIPYADRILLRRGGVPRGKLIHLWGKPQTCKSLCLYRMIAKVQEAEPDRTVVLFDTEQQAGDDLNEWLTTQGVDIDRLTLIDSARGPAVLRSAREMLKSGEVSLLAIDSIGNLIPRALARSREKQGADDTETELAEFARLLSREVKRVAEAAKIHDAFLIFTNQVRDNIGVMYGDRYRYPGGWCLEHNVKVSMLFSRVDRLKDKDSGEQIGMTVKITLDKCKIAPAGSSTPDGQHAYFIFDKPGEDGMLDFVFDNAIRTGLLQSSGGWIKWPEKDLKWHGRNEAMSAIRDDVSLIAALSESADAETSTAFDRNKLVRVKIATSSFLDDDDVL